MALAIHTEDDAGNGRNLRAVQQYVGCFATVLLDQARVGKGLECAGRICTRVYELIET